MRKIIASEFYSLDGLIADAEEQMQWVLDIFSDELGEYESDLYDSADALMLGRVTYKIFEGHWPGVPDNPEMPDGEKEMAAKINGIKKIVFSRTLKEVVWNNSVLMHEINKNTIEEIKSSTGKNILVIGSSEIVRQLSGLGLIDEYHFIVHPVVLGKGNKLFDDTVDLNLKLNEIRKFPNGVTGMFYSRGDAKGLNK